jgi:hypothetical protein
MVVPEMKEMPAMAVVSGGKQEMIFSMAKREVMLFGEGMAMIPSMVGKEMTTLMVA